MDDRTLPTRSGSPALEQFTESLEAARGRARALLAAQRGRLEQMEVELARHMQLIAEDLERDRDEVESDRSSISEQAAMLDQQRAALADDQNEWEQTQEEAYGEQQALAAQLQNRCDELNRQEQSLHERELAAQKGEDALRTARRKLESQQQELEDESAETARIKRRLEEKQQSLDELREKLDQQWSETKEQRRRIARELQAQRDQLQREREDLPSAGDDQQLRDEIAALTRRNEELETQTQAKAPADNARLQKKMHDLQRRFEMAVEDLREVKLENNELKQELSEAQRSASQRPAARNAGSEAPLDWEAQKQQLLASLEADFDEDDEDDQKDRLTIEGTIQITDEVVMEKDREIDELKHMLDQQSSNVGSMAVGAAAIASALDQDALIVEERERLAALKSQWEEKLRQAEVDLSVERAQLARQKAELEAKAQHLQTEVARFEGQGGGAKEAKASRGRWLARLGLGDEEKK